MQTSALECKYAVLWVVRPLQSSIPYKKIPKDITFEVGSSALHAICFRNTVVRPAHGVRCVPESGRLLGCKPAGDVGMIVPRSKIQVEIVVKLEESTFRLCLKVLMQQKRDRSVKTRARAKQ